MSLLTDILGGAATVLTGGIGGAVLRLLPEAIKLFQAKGDRDHEYRMRELDWKIAKDQSEQRIRETDAAGAVVVRQQEMDLWRDAIAAQGQKTGVWWADALNILVRPLTTYYFLALFGAAKFALFWTAIAGGVGVPQAILMVWTPDDSAMLAGLLSFWFVGRTFDKGK